MTFLRAMPHPMHVGRDISTSIIEVIFFSHYGIHKIWKSDINQGNNMNYIPATSVLL